MVTVFSTGPSCHRCLITKKHLERRGVPYVEVRIDLEENSQWAERLKEMGFTQAPVVQVDDDDVWEGYSADSIDELGRDMAVTAA